MATRLSSFLNVRPSTLKKLGVFDAIIGIDSRLFIDPILLKPLRIPEFANSRNRFEKYFQDVLLLLTRSTKRNDVAWREAKRRLLFKETKGVSLGYGIATGDGTGIGPVLGNRLLETGSEVVGMGIVDPAIFELLGLFEEGFGPDRLSDMTIAIIREDLFNYSLRVARSLGVNSFVSLKTPHGKFRLPKGPANKPLVFIPSRLLRRLPVAQSWDEIADVVSFNAGLRRKLNRLINAYWRKGISVLKANVRATFFANPDELRQLLKGYAHYSGRPYDVLSDPQGLLSWFELGKEFAKRHPMALGLSATPTIDEVERVVETIIQQFKDLIETNGLNIHLYDKRGKRLHERYSQRLFYAIADSYCKANEVDLNPEPNAGSGPVDFKFSKGYSFRVLAEIKLSTNSQLLHGFEKQLPTYERAEKTTRSAYVIVRVARSDSSIKQVLKIRDAAIRAGKKVPTVFVIDGRRKPAASKRK